MIYLIIKTLITAMVVVAASEIAKRSSIFAGIIISIPLTTFLALMWLYWETNSQEKVIALTHSTLMMAIPSLSFFIFLPILLKNNLSFFPSMFGSIFLTAICYWIFIWFIHKLGYSGL
tara:strand:+ start:502 stop:855 length:354 start_codon:yes stop_codon:yes gene_type:complete